MALQPGATLGPYEILSLIGAGGMGEVYLAREQGLGRRVALKVLPPEFTHDAHRIARFEQEARSASALSHPNICTIFALGELPDGRHFIAMEYIDGHTLRHRLSADRVSLRDALDISSQIAAGVSAAHAVGIIHRDLKPENVVIRPDGLVKVVDFGLAKLALPTDAHGGGTTHLEAKTDPGSAVGTIAYMSPEQARAQEVDARTDIWSLGVLLYEMVAGRTPFAGTSSSDVLAAILDRDPPPLARFDPQAPPELQRIIGKALRKDREQRYQGMKDLLLDLQALRESRGSQALSGDADARGPGPEAPPTSTPAASTGVASRSQSSAEYVVTGLARHKVVAALGAGILAVIISGTWWAIRNRPTGGEGLRSSAPVQRTLTRLTFGPGLQTDVTWSPDGRFIAYASDKAGNFDIWVQSVGGGDPVQVTRSAAQDTQPDWSPDGSRLVFRSERDGGGVFLVPALGGAERQLTSFGSYPSWSPDSSEILFVEENGFGSGESEVRLYAVSPEEGAPREILADFLRGGSWSWLARHPDGRMSVLGRHSQLGPGFFTMAQNGTQLVHSKESPGFPLRVYEGGYYVRRRFRWHPSGTALYVQTRSNGLYNLWKVHVDPSTLEWRSAERLTTGAGSDVAPTLSRDGTRLGFSTEQGSQRLWVFPLDPVARRLGSGKPVTEDHAIAGTSALSPDGQRVAYNLNRSGTDRDDLWVTNIIDGASELVATNAHCLCAWSPDGKTIAYNYIKYDSEPFTLRVAIRHLGGKERFLSQWTPNFFAPSDWSVARGLFGTYFTGEEASLAFWPTTNSEADKPERVLISEPKTHHWQARFSPNGRWLSFLVSKGGLRYL